MRVVLEALSGIPRIQPRDDLAAILDDALRRAEVLLDPCDVLVVTSKVVSRAEGRFVRLSDVEPSWAASDLAATTGKDPRLVELALRESRAVSRAAPGVLIVRHRLGHISANAGIDASNVGREGEVLLLPVDPDDSAARLREALAARTGVWVGIVISDSLGRPFRLGTVGHAIGAAGVEALGDRRGRPDLDGRLLEHTFVATADQIAAAADMVAGQAAEARPVVLVRGLSVSGSGTARDLLRPPDQDLYA